MKVMNGESLTHCLTCGDEIPKARRKLQPGVTLCVDCAGEEERKRKLL
jgi:phage/conjugal plasmid C-4 type zinc finger TraR family protein